MDEQLPIPTVANWQVLYESGARARCIKANPPMRGFGRALNVGDVVDIDGVTWSGRYELAVRSECAFYALEGYFEVCTDASTKDHG